MVHIRPIEPGDVDALARMFPRLSPETIYRRFFTMVTRPRPSVLRHLAVVDHHDREALVAEVDGEIIAVARYDRLRDDPSSAEVAVLVEDAWQRHGIARMLLAELRRRAVAEGITTFTADVLSENAPVVSLVHAIAPQARVVGLGPERQVRIPLAV